MYRAETANGLHDAEDPRPPAAPTRRCVSFAGLRENPSYRVLSAWPGLVFPLSKRAGRIVPSGGRTALHRLPQQRLDLGRLEQPAFGLDRAVDGQDGRGEYAVFGDVAEIVELLDIGLDLHFSDDGDHAPPEFIRV